LTRTVLTRALAEIDDAIPAFAVTSTGNSVITDARRVVARAITAMNDAQIAIEDKMRCARDLLAASTSVAGAVRSAAEELWKEEQVAPYIAARIREEVVVLVVLAGRDGRALQIDLIRRLKNGTNDFGAIAEILWPPLRLYRVATVIFGTRRLEDLGRLLPGAQQWPLVGLEPPAGAPTIDVRTMLNRALQAHGSKMLLIVPAEAADAYTAIAQARRNVTETLDQYVAGQRLLSLEIGAESVAIGADNRPTMSEDLVSGAKLARPLTSHWSTPVRPALRMASLAGRMEAPVASVMLAWSALESLGVDAGAGLELVAKACALHTVRQQVVSCFKSVTAAASARVEFARQSVYWTGKFLGQAERAYYRVSHVESARAKDALRDIEERLPRLRSRHTDAESFATAVTQQIASEIRVIQRDLLGGIDPNQPLQASSYSLDVNQFLDAMLPPPAQSADPASESRKALATLAESVGGLAREQFLSWRSRLADPTTLADWIDAQQTGFHGLLAWMYASRNLAIHTGGFVVPADVLTAQAARGIVDMVLEFLGYWYKHLDTHAEPERNAIDIITDLAERKDQLGVQLRVADSCHSLNVATITGPDSECWNRS
jgi:hypothetical protein